MISFSSLFRTVSYYLCTGVALFLVAPVVIIIVLLPAQWRYRNPIMKWIEYAVYTIMQKSLFIPITVEGEENIPPGPIILAANHQSAIDVPLIGRLFKSKPHIWFFKHEIGKIPIIGAVPRRIFVSVDPSTPRTAVKTLTAGLNLITQHKLSLGIFPEGSRFSDGKIHDFFWGFAIIAKKTKLPVVPVFIKDSYKVYPRGGFMLHKAPVRLTIGKPFYYCEHEEEEVFRQRVFQWFVEQSKK